MLVLHQPDADGRHAVQRPAAPVLTPAAQRPQQRQRGETQPRPAGDPTPAVTTSLWSSHWRPCQGKNEAGRMNDVYFILHPSSFILILPASSASSRTSRVAA